MLTVTALARACGTTPHTIRYYSRMGLLREKRHPDNEYRLFDAAEQARLRFILHAKELGYTLKEIRMILDDADRGESPCPRVRQILQQHIEQNRRRITSLVRLQERMERALDAWDAMPDGVPTGDSVCHLIEAFAEGNVPPADDAEDEAPLAAGGRVAWMS